MSNDELQKLKDKVYSPLTVILNTSKEDRTLKEAIRILNYINNIEAKKWVRKK